jgi:hypothetical protein
MSTNISYIDTWKSTLRISKTNAKKARRDIEMPSSHNLDDLVFGSDGYAPIKRFSFEGNSSGWAYGDGRLAAFVALLEGDADLVLTWADGEWQDGLRIRDGKMTACKVITALEPEKPTKKKRGKGPELTTVAGIRAALFKAARRPRDLTNYEVNQALDGLDRLNYWSDGYSKALREFAKRLPK